MIRWFIARCRIDRKAEESLKARDYEVYRPVFLETRIQRRRQVVVPRSLFEKYLFVREHDQGWEPLRFAPGIFTFDPLLQFDGVFAWLDEKGPSFQRIKTIEAHLQAEFLEGEKPPFKAGDRISINDGPYAGQWAIIEKLDKRNRISCLMKTAESEMRLKGILPSAVSLVGIVSRPGSPR